MNNTLRYNKSDVIYALNKAGLNKGDTAYFSTSLGMVGIADGVTNAEALNQLFYNAITETLTEQGTAIVPTYSYTFGGSSLKYPKVFDPETTIAQIGPFPEFFRHQKGVIRSLEPMMSMAAIGRNATSLFKDLPSTSYGYDSVYERLLDIKNAKCVSIGLGPNWTPFIHYADWLQKVPHRYDKLFYGGIKQGNGDIHYGYWVYSVPARIKQSSGQAHILGGLAVKEGIWRYAKLGRARVYVADYKDYFEFAMSLMKKNKWLMTHGEVCNVLKEDQKKMNKSFPIKTNKQESELNIYNDIAVFSKLARPVVSNHIEILMEYINKIIPLTIDKYQTGENIFDWIVPEWEQEHSGKKLSAISYLLIAEYSKIDAKNKSFELICCYLDGKSDINLSGLNAILKLFKQIKDSKKNIKIAFLPGPLGLAAYLAKNSNINKAIHLLESTNDILASGNNPIAKKTVKDLQLTHIAMHPDRLEHYIN